MGSRREEVARTVERLVEEASGWPHVTTGEHRFGGTEFPVGSREIGHVHAWGMLDVASLGRLRDVLVEAGLTDVHHLLADSGRTTSHLESGDDFEHARWLLRLSYLSHVNTLQRTPAGPEELSDVDVEAEARRLDLDDDVLAAFERRPP
jgi:hypothetical protein